MNTKYLSFFYFLFSLAAFSQEHFPKNDGVKTKTSNFTAFTNAKIIVSPTQTIENGTLLIKEGKVVSVGTSISIPKNTEVFDLSGKSVYPSFIDLYSSFGITKPKRPTNNSRSPQYDASREGFYWNDHIRSEQNAIDHYKFDSKKAKELRKAGFGVVNTHLQDGIIRGSGSLIAITEEDTDANRILETNSAQYLSLRKSVLSRQSYPTSLMGTMALLRQLNYDADWYVQQKPDIKDKSIEAFIANKNMVQIIEAGNKKNALRVDRVGDQFGVQYVIVGGGDEYERIDAIKATNATYIIPINFPKAYDLEDPILASSLSLSDMREWNQKPANPKLLAEKNVPFVFTSYKLKETKEFLPNVLKAIEYGLDKKTALQALTTVPASVLGKSSTLGSLKKGAYANFLITSGDVFEKGTDIHENWVKGKRSIVKPMNVIDIRGAYQISALRNNYDIDIAGTLSKLKTTVKSGTKELGSKTTYKDHWLNITFSSIDSAKQEYVRLVSKVINSNKLEGKLVYPNGTEVAFTSDKKEKEKKSKDASKSKKEPKTIVPIKFPNEAYGFEKLPQQQTILFKNATVWTNEKEGILKSTDVLIKDGKISKIGSNLNASNATIIDASGKHLTSGIIDEHSHIATSSVNESGHNSTAEVSIEDVLDDEDVDIYRNLAGGVTTIQILHGSANPIGGRSALIKLKWGETAENLKFKNAPKFIKFALGENVKQSNWGDNAKTRFPQTRMGVEQVYIDYFQRAKEYEKLKKSGKPFRKDIEMEVLVEILNKERFITCHSYIQSEINMLMKVAEKFNFNINTFTHILEGYKVADKMVNHGVGGSTFSDWWAYKYEVNDAIPFNAAIMHNAGVTVAINSDDAEMARRLNQEAAKSVKYGNVSEEEAWKFVTLNPAKLLHIDDKVGSIKVGKHADVVLWNNHPLSIYAKPEKTIIEGVVYFDIERDLALRTSMKLEKNELSTQMLQAKNKGLKTQTIKKKVKKVLHCDSVEHSN